MKPLNEMTEIEKSELLLGVMGWEQACDGQNLYTTDRHVFMKIMQSLLNGDSPLAKRYQRYVKDKFARLGGDINNPVTMVLTNDVIQDVVLELALELGLVGD